ncbi:MAG: ice-binding family protein [Kiritimatiellia bacterium]
MTTHTTRNVFLTAAIVACIGTGVTASTVSWGTAGTFAVLGNQSVTSAGATTIDGDLGVSPGTSITGSPTVTGTIHINNATATQAQADANTAYNLLIGLAVTQTLASQLGGTTLTPGVYKFTSEADLTGDLTLSGQGEYIFQIGSTLITAANSKVKLTNGAVWEDVFFAVGSSATLGADTDFFGNIIAHTSDTLGANASVNGRVIALGGSVSLYDGSYVVIPEPSSAALLLVGVVTLLVAKRRTFTTCSDNVV